MFPDSKIPEQLELGRTKLGYLLQFSLAWYSKEQLFSSLLPITGFAPKFVSCSVKAFNHISKQKQTDVHVFYFHEEKQQVVRSYIGSHFLGHANAEETFQSIWVNIWQTWFESQFGASFNGRSKCEFENCRNKKGILRAQWPYWFLSNWDWQLWITCSARCLWNSTESYRLEIR